MSFDRLVTNFAKHVDRSAGPKGCWPWTATRQSKGYGCLGYLCADGVMRRFLAHRVALMLATSQFFIGETQVMHSCDNRPCCNPRHLFVGSQSDNMRDAVKKGRIATGEKNGNYKHGRYTGYRAAQVARRQIREQQRNGIPAALMSHASEPSAAQRTTKGAGQCS